MYFNCIAVFEVLYRWASVEGGAHVHFVGVWMSKQSISSTALQTWQCN